METRKLFMLIVASLHTLKHFHHLKLLILSTRIRSSKTTVSYGKRIWVTNSEVLEKSSQSFSKQEKGKLWCMQSVKTKLGKELSISSGSGTEKTELQQWQLLLGGKKKKLPSSKEMAFLIKIRKLWKCTDFNRHSYRNVSFWQNILLVWRGHTSHQEKGHCIWWPARIRQWFLKLRLVVQ